MHEPNWLMGLGVLVVGALWWFCFRFIMFECACIMATLHRARARQQ